MTIDQFVKQAYSWGVWLCQQAVGLGILVILTATVLGLFGMRVPFVPAMDLTPLAYLCGAWWLYRKAG